MLTRLPTFVVIKLRPAHSHQISENSSSPTATSPTPPSLSAPSPTPAEPLRVERHPDGKGRRVLAEGLGLGRGQRCTANLGRAVSVVADTEEGAVPSVIVISQRGEMPVRVAAEILQRVECGGAPP